MLSQDFIDILKEFFAEEVEFMVVGGYAVAFHGYVRGTADFDLWIRISSKNAERTWRALKKFGAPLADTTVEDFAMPGTVYQVGVPPNRIDVINSIEAVEFDDAWNKRTYFDFEGLSIPVAGKADLLANKRAVNRPKDHGDIFWLENNLES